MIHQILVRCDLAQDRGSDDRGRHTITLVTKNERVVYLGGCCPERATDAAERLDGTLFTCLFTIRAIRQRLKGNEACAIKWCTECNFLVVPFDHFQQQCPVYRHWKGHEPLDTTNTTTAVDTPHTEFWINIHEKADKLRRARVLVALGELGDWSCARSER